KYKPVAKRVKPIPMAHPEHLKIRRQFPSPPLENLPILPHHPPPFTPGRRLTQERYAALSIHTNGFLWPDEIQLFGHIMKIHELAFAWTESEIGRFRDDYFDPVVFPTVPHVPWQSKHIPTPPGLVDKVIKILKDKIAAGAYEPSQSSYRSTWFTVAKPHSNELRAVVDLQPLNGIMTATSGVPPFTDFIVDTYAKRSAFTVLDLFRGFE
ncbi:hypothetical protein CALVIDRAFT_460541, partial [Calocera viscosa TUFC12733]